LVESSSISNQVIWVIKKEDRINDLPPAMNRSWRSLQVYLKVDSSNCRSLLAGIGKANAAFSSLGIIVLFRILISQSAQV
jgi:hypothetical protein